MKTPHSPVAPPAFQRQRMERTAVAHVEWRKECTAVWNTYGRWATANAADAAAAHAAYWAALEREEAAATVYAKLVEDVDHWRGPTASRTNPQRED
jgi:hypothetical protein